MISDQYKNSRIVLNMKELSDAVTSTKYRRNSTFPSSKDIKVRNEHWSSRLSEVC